LAISALSNGEQIQGFDNVLFNPLHVEQLADALYCLATSAADYRGVLHVGCGDIVSKFDFLMRLAKTLDLPAHNIRRATYENSPTGIQRPLNTSLCTDMSLCVLKNAPYSLTDGIELLQETPK